MANPTPLYVFDERSGRFRNTRTGRFVPQSQVTAALNDVIAAAAAEMRAASVSLQTGGITLAQWQLVAERSIKNINIVSYALARGGFNQMSQSDYGRVGREIRTQYEYLRKMVNQIATGQQKLDGRFLQRIDQYVQSGRTVYEKERMRQAVNRGAMFVRTIRHARDSCEGCITQAGYGWIPIDSPLFVPVGNRNCRKNCKCTLEFATAEEAGFAEAA